LPVERRLAPWVTAVLEDISLFLGEVFLTSVRIQRPVVCAQDVQAINITQLEDLKGVYNMNTRFLKTHSIRAALLLGSLGALTLPSNAQTEVARANVPFEFAAGGAMMPAGEYTIDVPDLSGVIMLHGSTGNSVALLSTFSGAISHTTTAKLLFERRDGMVYLSAVEWPDQSARVMGAFKHVTKGAVAAALR
jgi:hypothetical protein